MFYTNEMKENDSHWFEVLALAEKYGFVTKSDDDIAVLMTHKNQHMGRLIVGLPRLSGDFNRGYTRAIQDIIEIFTYIQPDLKHSHKNLNGRLSLMLLNCCLNNRDQLRDHRLRPQPGFIRYNRQKMDFEWFEKKN